MLRARSPTHRILTEETIRKNTIGSLQMKDFEIDNMVSIYPNQVETADKIINYINDEDKLFILVIGETQSGKTGIIYTTIKALLENSNNIISIANIYIVTGLSSIEWKQQTKSRFPEFLHKRIFHQNELTAFSDEIKDKHNILVFMDEVQIAAQPDQSIHNALKNAHLFGKDILHEKGVKIVEFSATPDGTFHDLMKMPHASSKIMAKSGEGYISSSYLLQMGRIKQYRDLCGYNKKTGQVDSSVTENILELKLDIDNYSVPKYHVVRTPCGSRQDITIYNIKQVVGETHYNFIKHDATNKTTDDINNILNIRPEKHTFVFIKETVRCAKTLTQTHLGVSYERYRETPNDTTIIQGLQGRQNGYEDNEVSICYTNIPSIEKYHKLLESAFEDKTIDWNSNTTKFNNGVLSGKKTFNDPMNFFSELSPTEGDESESSEPVIHKFNTFAEAKQYYNSELKEKLCGRGPRTRIPDENGFILSTIGKEKMETRTRVRTYEELHHYRKWNLNATHKYTFYPYYEDITDNTTLKWVMFHN